MRKIVLDVENTTSQLTEKYDDYTPYNPNNKLVSIGWCFIEDGKISPIEYIFLHHRDLYPNIIIAPRIIRFKNALKEISGLIAHNAKYDVQWLEEAGFDLSHLKIEDTMIREYIMARGRSDISFRLADTCKRYGVAEKGEIWSKYPKMQISEMPIAEVEEYGRGDIQACAELYLAQEERLNKDTYQGLRKTIDMSHEMCRVLIDLERTGVKIDDEALKKVETEFTAEAEQLKSELQLLVRKYMGDTTVNMDSPKQLSEVIYSRYVREGQEDTWLKVFNIGKDERGKNLRRPKMSFAEYSSNVQRMCSTVMRTEMHKCTECDGQGKIQKLKKDGGLFKKPTKCKPCNGSGAIFKDTNDIAGFMMMPENINWTTVSGFSTSHIFLSDLLNQAKQKGKEDAYVFIEKLMRLSSISSYLSNFVGGISVFKQADNILHTNFNQCITATGRLSSTKPNLQNMPRENTFPIRSVFVSRFKDGKIVDTDFSQLEFRTAVHQAKDEQGKKDILNGIDLHKRTSEIITEAGQSTTRQDAKRHCVPLDTRILSETGWKMPDQIKVGDLVLTHNIETGKNEWQPLEAINYYDDAQLYVIYNQYSKFFTTGEHRWVGFKEVQVGSDKHIKKELVFTTEDINTTYRIRRSADMANGDIAAQARKDFWAAVEIINEDDFNWTVEVEQTLHMENALQLATIAGYQIAVMQRRTRFKVRKTQYMSCGYIKREMVGKANVWCPTTKNGTWIMRQGKNISITGNSFKPLYGGQSGTEAERAYYKSFLNDLYLGIKKWHVELQEEAIATKMITIETGRQYLFPNVERAWHGGATSKTQIVNYPVQGLATADFVQIACIRLFNEMKKLNLKSKIILLVHDSCVVDAHPDEIEVVCNLMKKLGDYAMEEAKLRYNIDMYVPLTVETKMGNNAMQLQKVA